MIYTVSLNPSLDYAIHVNDFDTGRVNRTQYEEIFPGGKGVNVSLVLHNLNIKSKALGFTAGFIGAAFEKLLIANGLDIDFIRIPEGMTRICKSAEQAANNIVEAWTRCLGQKDESK